MRSIYLYEIEDVTLTNEIDIFTTANVGIIFLFISLIYILGTEKNNLNMRQFLWVPTKYEKKIIFNYTLLSGSLELLYFYAFRITDIHTHFNAIRSNIICLIFNSLPHPIPWIFTTFLSSADIFQNQLFRKILSGIQSECQIVWIQIWPDVLSGLIWVQTVCKSYQQTTLGDKELNDLPKVAERLFSRNSFAWYWW